MSFSVLMTWQKNASTERKMQDDMDQVSQACDDHDVKISTNKTEFMHHSTPVKLCNELVITLVKGQKKKKTAGC